MTNLRVALSTALLVVFSSRTVHADKGSAKKKPALRKKEQEDKIQAGDYNGQSKIGGGGRQLQIDFDETPLVIAGVEFSAEDTQEKCPNEWSQFVSCTVQECPNFVEVCPTGIFAGPDQTQGTMSLRSVHRIQQMQSSHNVYNPFLAKRDALDCSSIEESICTTYGDDGCCMINCVTQVQALLLCYIEETVVEEILECKTLTSCGEGNVLGPEEISQVNTTMEAYPCQEEDHKRFSCMSAGEFCSAEDPSSTTVETNINCALDKNVGFDFKQSEDCFCEAKLTRADTGEVRMCDCSICPLGSFVDTVLDCRNVTEYPYVYGNCTTMGCFGECLHELDPFMRHFDTELFADPIMVSLALKETDVRDGFYPDSFTSVQEEKLFFQAYADATGIELWVTDGTLNGTTLVKDINPGEDSSLDDIGTFEKESAALMNGTLVFFADDGIHGKELWTSDGTVNGTFMLADIAEGPDSVTVLHNSNGAFVQHGRKLVFGVLASEGSEPAFWVTDGTIRGTQPLGEDSIFSGIIVKSLVDLDDKLLFIGLPENERDLYLYASDGTVEGTGRLDLGPNVTISHSHDTLVEFQGKLYFRAASSLWTTDGTAEGTNEVKRPNNLAFSKPHSITAMNDDRLYFVSGCSLWRYDGTGFIQIINGDDEADLDDDESIRQCAVNDLAVLGNRIIFQRRGNETGMQPWVTDGTSEQTFRLVDASLTSNAAASMMVVYNNKVAFFVADAVENNGHHLWVTDGSIENTRIVRDIGVDQEGLFPHIDNLFVFQDHVYLTVWYLFEPGQDLWRVSISGPYAEKVDPLVWEEVYFKTSEPTESPEIELAGNMTSAPSDDNMTSAPSEDEQEGAMGNMTSSPSEDEQEGEMLIITVMANSTFAPSEGEKATETPDEEEKKKEEEEAREDSDPLPPSEPEEEETAPASFFNVNGFL
jgi:ELWxxDGT repeat protein